MTDEWPQIFDRVGQVPGGAAGSKQLTEQDVQERWSWVNKRNASDIALAFGGVDTGDDFDPWGSLTDYSTGVQDDISGTRDSLVNNIFGWLGSGWSALDTDAALANQAATISGLAAMIAALQSNQNNQSVGGTQVFIDFSGRSNATSLGADFTQTYAGSGTGQWGIVSGRATWLPVNDANRTCVGIYNVAHTTTDYQMVGASFAAAPWWSGSTANSGHNFLFARADASGSSCVFADMTAYTAQIGCIVSGVKTVFATASGFTFKGNSIYWLRAGTIGGARIFQLLEGARVVLTHTEVGTTSILGSEQVTPEDWRFGGAGVTGAATGFGTAAPGIMTAFALSDNQPAAVIGSGARMFRADTGGVDVSSGANILPADFFDTVAENTADITCDVSAGTFTVSQDGWYNVDFQAALADFTVGFAPLPPFPMVLTIYKTPSGGSPTLECQIGDVLMGIALSVFTTTSPRAASGSARIYLQAGDSVGLGYNANTSKTDVFIGDAGGVGTYFTITLANRSLA